MVAIVYQGCVNKTKPAPVVCPNFGSAMTTQSDPAVTISTLATALNVSDHRVTVRYLRGDLPTPDSVVRVARNRRGTRAWRLSTLCAWNPAVADRCAALLRALETIPLDAA